MILCITTFGDLREKNPGTTTKLLLDGRSLRGIIIYFGPLKNLLLDGCRLAWMDVG